MEFRYAATDEQFSQIAKLRAARRLWARVLELSEAGPTDQRQHVVTSRPMMSKYDPYVNMLRTTVAAFAAGVGGADSVTVLPFDSPLGRPETLGRRIARNTSPLLMWESHVAKVADPAGGSYAVEKLTDDLAVAAWEELGRIETEGSRRSTTGSPRWWPLAKGGRQAQAADHRAHRVPQPRRGPARARARRRVRRGRALRRQLRGAARRPPLRPVFLATLGTVAAHTARATFAANLLAAGGIAIEPAGADRRRRRAAGGVRRPDGGLPRRLGPDLRRVGGVRPRPPCARAARST